MIEWFEGNYQKMIKIIKMLYFSDDWKTKKQLAEYAGCSESTFIRYMKEIKSLWGDSLKIETSKKMGYRIKSFNISDYIHIIKDMTNGSTVSRLLHEIIIYPGKNIEDYCETLNISSSSFSRKLKQCNQILEPYNIHLSVNKGYQLFGENEKELRVFVTYFFLEFYGHNALPFSLEPNKVKNILKKNNCKLNWLNEENTFEHVFFVMLFTVHLIREIQGHELSRYKKNTPSTQNSGWSYFKRRMTGLTHGMYNNIITFFQKDLLQWSSKSEQIRVKNLIEKNIRKSHFFTFLNFDREHSKFLCNLISTIYLFNKSFPFHTSKLTHRISIFAQQIKYNDGNLFSLLQNDLEFFSDVLGTDLKYHLSIYVYWFLTGKPEFGQYFSSKKILAVSDLGLQHAEILATYISNGLSFQKINIRVIPTYTALLSQYNFSNFDLIVSNQPIPNSPLPVFLINDDFTGLDKQKFIDILSPIDNP